VSTFEDITPTPPATYTNDAGASGFFSSGGNSFNNNYDRTYGVWSGWAVSDQTDISNPGGKIPDYNFQYTSVTGSGAGGSLTYGVANTSSIDADPFHPAGSFVNLAPGSSPVSVQITNTAYDYYSMVYGDGFAHAFGAGDFLLLTIDGYSSTDGLGSKVGEIDFYLANFQGSNAYIVTTWQTLDLSSLAGSQSLVFGLESSDNNPIYGINTPAEFALDNLTAQSLPIPEPSSWLLCLIGTGVTSLIFRRKRAPR
jgi:hypothetical protein